MAVIYHGTPLTPRAALTSVCTGRAMCVSFYRPDDVEVVEAISPAIMFRQRRVFVLEAGNAFRPRVGGRSRLDALFRVVGISPVPSRQVGGNSGHAGSAKPAQRRIAQRLAFRPARRSALAHGWTARKATAALRAIRPGMSWLDRSGQGHRLPSLSAENGRSSHGSRQPLAGSSHDARDRRCLRLPFYQRRQHIAGAEWMAL